MKTKTQIKTEMRVSVCKLTICLIHVVEQFQQGTRMARQTTGDRQTDRVLRRNVWE